MSEELYSYYDIARQVWGNIYDNFKIKLEDEELYFADSPNYNYNYDDVLDSVEFYLRSERR